MQRWIKSLRETLTAIAALGVLALGTQLVDQFEHARQGGRIGRGVVGLVHDHAEVGERRIIATPYGDSPPFVYLTANGHSAWFSSRHGEDGLQRTAAFVNHRANLWAARELGAA